MTDIGCFLINVQAKCVYTVRSSTQTKHCGDVSKYIAYREHLIYIRIHIWYLVCTSGICLLPSWENCIVCVSP